ncbi:flagellin [Bacteriovoracaceae bacterium]|nr:flagellin [Bacteriovoracaceae bacterium]
MGFRINTNVSSLQARKSLRKVTSDQSKTFAQLSSGQRINNSADDAAGLAISEKLKATIRSQQQAERNTNDGISMIQVAEGALGEVSNTLIRLRELSIQAASDTIGEVERGYTNLEYQQLKKEVQRISETTSFNGNTLLDGQGEKLDFQIGIRNNDFQDRISYDTSMISAGLEALGITDVSLETKTSSQESLTNLDSAIQNISGQRAELGALQNRLVTTSQNLQTSVENFSAANSRIRDVDYAEATADNAKNNILSSAATSVLGQANSAGSAALRLIG